MRKKSGMGNIVRLQIKQQLFTRKLAVACAAVLIVCLRVFSPLVRFAQANGVSVSPLGGVTFFFGTFQALFLNSFVLILGVFLFSGAPFFGEEQSVCLLRCGRARWMSAQLVTLLGIALCCVLMWVAGIFLVLLPVAGWGLEWDSVWRTLSFAQLPSLAIPLDTPPYIIRNYAPLEAFWYSCALKFLAFALIGYVVYFGNLVGRPPLGTGLGILLALEDAFFLNTLWAKYMWLSPSTMSRLYMLEKVREYAAPTPWEAMALMGGAVLALALAARWMGPRRLEA